ncbi:SRPBCC family protein [Pseudarthrobacter sp. So.54]
MWSVSRRVPASAEDVWALLTDTGRWAAWGPSVTGVESAPAGTAPLPSGSAAAERSALSWGWRCPTPLRRLRPDAPGHGGWREFRRPGTASSRRTAAASSRSLCPGGRRCTCRSAPRRCAGLSGSQRPNGFPACRTFCAGRCPRGHFPVNTPRLCRPNAIHWQA